MQTKKLRPQHFALAVVLGIYLTARWYYTQIHDLLLGDFAVNQVSHSDAAQVSFRMLLQAGDMIGAIPIWLVAVVIAMLWRISTSK